VAAAAAGVVALTVAAFLYVASALQGLPDASLALLPPHSTVIYDGTGGVLAERNKEGAYHVRLQLNQMGRNNILATLAAEDRDYYQHGAFSLPAAMRAALVDVIANQPVEGGSNITQQLVRIELLGPAKTIRRKIQEAFLASQLEQRYSKDEILELYLNRVFYGHGAYGIGAAAKTYFGSDKNAKDLTIGEAAFLAGLLSAPSANDPQLRYQAARTRELYVLDQMASAHMISANDKKTAAAEDIARELRYDTTFRQTRSPHFVDYVMTRLEAQFGAAALQGGFTVSTTLDAKIQALAERAVSDGVPNMAGLGVNNGMLLAARPSTGEILAWVGSAGYNNDSIGGQFDIIRSPRSPGSSFKPYVYAAALHDHRITLATCVHDEFTDFSGYTPQDFDGQYLGTMTARRALLLSRNIPAVEVANKEGITRINSLATELGIHSPLQPYLSTAIGGSDVTMLEHLQGYQVFANQGYKVPLISITRIVDGTGNVVYERKPGTQDVQAQVLPSTETYLITSVLKDYQDLWQLGFDRRMASKSGTSGSPNTGQHDAWMMAYNRDIVVGAWAGNTVPGGAGESISAFGVDTGQRLLAPFINSLPQDWDHWYRQPSRLVRGVHGELFLPGTEKMTTSCGERGHGREHGHDHGDDHGKREGGGQGQQGGED